MSWFPRDGQRAPALDHTHDELQDLGRGRPAVDEVAEEDGLAPVGVAQRVVVAERAQQRRQLVEAAVDVADDVERPVLVPLVVVQRLARDLDRVDLLHRLQHVRVAEALASEEAERAAHGALLVAHDVRPELAVRPQRVALVADARRHIEGDGHRERVVLAGDGDERLAVLRLDVRGVDDRQLRARQALAHDRVQQVEGVVRRGLVVLVVGDEAAAEVGRHDLRRLEVLARERRLAGAGRPDQRHERQLGDLDVHRVNTPICVGGPTSSSSGPTARQAKA
jgi:hypothetical protein